MARLQFRHKNEPFETRNEAVQYIKDIVDSEKVISESFGGSVLAEPIVVKYLDNGKEQVILAIGVQDGGNVPYHIIDSAKYEEGIAELSGLTQDILDDINNLLSDVADLSGKVEDIESELDTIEESIDALSGNSIVGVEINTLGTDWEGDHHSGITAKVVNNVAYFENFSTDNIKVSDGYEGQLIHHDHSLTDFIAAVEGLHFKKVTTGLESNVKEQYELVDGDDNKLGDEVVKIYKDSAYKEIYLGTSADTINTTTGEITKLEGNKQSLNYAYMKADGTYDLVKVDVSTFLIEAEFASGVTGTNGIVHGVVDPSSENFLSVGGNGFKISGVQAAITNAVDAEKSRAEEAEQELQDELNATQSGAGLDTNGSYIHDHNTNYIDEATSLANADHKLDSALKVVEDKVDNLSASTESFISGTTAKETELSEKIEALSSQTSYLSDLVAAETNRALAAESELSGNVVTESSIRQDADNALQNKINAEEQERINADIVLSGRITALEAVDILGVDAISVTETDGDDVISLNINQRDNILSQDANGLSARVTIGIEHESNTEYIVLKGVNDAELSRVDASAFVKDGMLENVELIGDILRFTFNTDSGKESIDVPLSSFVDTYVVDPDSQAYLRLNDHVFSVNVGNDGLATASNLNTLSGRVDAYISQLYKDSATVGSIRHELSDSMKTPVNPGDPSDADNNNLLRYAVDPVGGDKIYYASNKTDDMVYSGQNLSDVIAQIEEELVIISGKSAEADLSGLFAASEYNSSDKKIYFKDLSGVTVSTIDASDFIKDGMIDTVKIGVPSGGTHAGENCLMIIFNTDSGKEEIDIPITDFFDADNYYTKQETDTTFLSLSAYSEDKNAIDEALDNLSGAVVNNETNIDILSGLVESLSGNLMDNYYTKQEISDKELVISAALNVLNDKITDVEEKSQEISDNLDNLSGSVVNNETNILILSGAISSMTPDAYTKQESDNLFMSLSAYEIDERVIAEAFNDLNNRLNAVYSKEEVDALISGITATIDTIVEQKIKSLLIGTARQIKITDTGTNLQIGFDDNAIFG